MKCRWSKWKLSVDEVSVMKWRWSKLKWGEDEVSEDEVKDEVS